MILLKKKRTANPLSSTIDQRPNQLLEPVSPFEEILKPDNPIRFMKSYNFHRRHSLAREQLAKLKAKHCLVTAGQTVAPYKDDAQMGFRDTPIRIADKFLDITQPIELKVAKSSIERKTKMKDNNSHQGRTYLSTFRPPRIPSDIFATRCEAHYPAGEGACAALPFSTNDHEIPFIISVTKLDEDDEDDENSEISLEDILKLKSSTATETTAPTMSNSHSQSFTTATLSTQRMPYPRALVGITKSCMPSTASDLASWETNSSISWPSDEDSTIERNHEDSSDILDVEDGPQLITAVHDLNCDDGSSHYFKADMACGGFKFWSIGEAYKSNLIENGVSKDDINAKSAARDEEECRDKDLEKVREEIPFTAASV